MSEVALIFPNQLFPKHPAINGGVSTVYLIEDSLYFGDSEYPASMHSLKLQYHKDTMDSFEESLASADYEVRRIEYESPRSQLPTLFDELKKEKASVVRVCDPHDFELLRRLKELSIKKRLHLELVPSPGFINTREENQSWRASSKSWNMSGFYQHQRRRLNVLMELDKPVGGKWNFDDENRKRLPKAEIGQLPELPWAYAVTNKQISEAPTHSKNTTPSSIYPTTREGALDWLNSFYAERFQQFGPYEDAIVEGQNWLYHSVLTPMLNVGLLDPKEVIDTAIDAAVEYNVPLNSLEGFIRQIMGWREFMRATYDDIGVQMRIGNHWNHHNDMPVCFYDGTTGILPVDDAIARIKLTGYCHHIERLMVLGGFMFLCEIKPNSIYTWFMEMFIDSYDWVMVPNVYAMSQNSDGGLITTKPYFSGSNYIIKMSHYKKGEWSTIWDALFWRWIINNEKKLAGNHRWSMMVSHVKKMSVEKKKEHLRIAEAFLNSIF